MKHTVLKVKSPMDEDVEDDIEANEIEKEEVVASKKKRKT
jgi:hypothetical protein